MGAVIDTSSSDGESVRNGELSVLVWDRLKIEKVEFTDW